MPDEPGAWLITVSMNLLRNMKTSKRRRDILLNLNPGEHGHSSQSPAADQETLDAESQASVRRTLDSMPERERNILLLRAEGFRYAEIANALHINEASVGKLLSRAQVVFRERYESANAH